MAEKFIDELINALFSNKIYIYSFQTMNEFNEITQQVGSQSNSLMQDIDIGSLVTLKQSFLQLEGALECFKITDSAGSFIPANEILYAIFQNGFPPSTFPKVINELDAISSFQGELYENDVDQRILGRM